MSATTEKPIDSQADPTAIQMWAVTSTTFESIGYDEASQTLAVKYAGGAVYHVRPVTPHCFSAFKTAPSKGRFYNEEFKQADRYTVTRVFVPVVESDAPGEGQGVADVQSEICRELRRLAEETSKLREAEDEYTRLVEAFEAQPQVAELDAHIFAVRAEVKRITNRLLELADRVGP